MELGLGGRRILITGASKGIGRALAEAFAREGAHLEPVARSGDVLELLADELRQRHAIEARAHSISRSPTARRRWPSACPRSTP